MSFDPHHFYTNRRRRSTRNGQIIQKKPVVRTPIYSSRDLPGLLSAVRAFGYDTIPRSVLTPFPFSYSEVHGGTYVVGFNPLGSLHYLYRSYLLDFVRTDFDQLFNLNMYHPVDGTFQMHVEIRVFAYSLLLTSAAASRTLDLSFTPSNVYARTIPANNSGVMSIYPNSESGYAIAFGASVSNAVNDNSDKSALASYEFDGDYQLYQDFKDGHYGDGETGYIVMTALDNSISRISFNFEIFISVSYQSQWWLGNQ